VVLVLVVFGGAVFISHFVDRDDSVAAPAMGTRVAAHDSINAGPSRVFERLAPMVFALIGYGFLVLGISVT